MLLGNYSGFIIFDNQPRQGRMIIILNPNLRPDISNWQFTCRTMRVFVKDRRTDRFCRQKLLDKMRFYQSASSKNSLYDSFPLSSV